MKKLDQTQQEKVETARTSIKHLQDTELIIYDNLVNEIEVDDDWLYDYVFNCAVEDEYSEMVKSKIFE
jgi:hypothetical protein